MEASLSESRAEPVGPVDGRLVPRYAGASTFARLPELDRVTDYDVAVLGVPFDNGVSYRPGPGSARWRYGRRRVTCGPATTLNSGYPRLARSRWRTRAMCL